MRRRLYFLLPDLLSARALLDELLLARIEERHIKFLARRGTLPKELPEATVWEKTDVVHGAQLGMVIGGIAGAIAGTLAVLFPPEGVTLQLVTVLVSALIGTGLGAWVSSMAAAAVPNSKLKQFHSAVDAGKVLLMVDVPYQRLSDIRDLVLRRHPEATGGGMEPTIPAFP
ncbi:MAG TPA: DUF1269 domain-containing protein [Burkholderiales bacterium]